MTRIIFLMLDIAISISRLSQWEIMESEIKLRTKMTSRNKVPCYVTILVTKWGLRTANQ